MGCAEVLVIGVVGGIVVAIVGAASGPSAIHGPVNPHMGCPHCGTKGQVHTKAVSQKKGISGGKATAGLLTGGVSLLATGLSRKEKATRAFCKKCNNTWTF